MNKLPSTEEMLCDLAKVEGLDWVFQLFGAVMAVEAKANLPSVFTEGELEVIEAANTRYTITDKGRDMLKGRE